MRRCAGCARKGLSSKHRRTALTDFVQDKDQPLALAFSLTDLLPHKPAPAAFRISGPECENDDVRLVHHCMQRENVGTDKRLLDLRYTARG